MSVLSEVDAESDMALRERSSALAQWIAFYQAEEWTEVLQCRKAESGPTTAVGSRMAQGATRI